MCCLMWYVCIGLMVVLKILMLCRVCLVFEFDYVDYLCLVVLFNFLVYYYGCFRVVLIGDVGNGGVGLECFIV